MLKHEIKMKTNTINNLNMDTENYKTEISKLLRKSKLVVIKKL